MGASEIRDLRRLKREQIETRHVFLTERRAPISTAGFRKMLTRVGEEGEFPFPVHPHMLRHAWAATNWQMMGRIRERYNTTSGTRTSSIQCATRSCPRIASKASGMIEGTGPRYNIMRFGETGTAMRFGADMRKHQRAGRRRSRSAEGRRAVVALIRARDGALGSWVTSAGPSIYDA
jgi:hypothetical protein